MKKSHVHYIRSLLFLKCLDIFHLLLFETHDGYVLLLWTKTDFCTEKYFMCRCAVLQFKVAVIEIACFSLLWDPSAFSVVCRKWNAAMLGWGWWVTRSIEDTVLANCSISAEGFVKLYTEMTRRMIFHHTLAMSSAYYRKLSLDFRPSLPLLLLKYF